MTGLAARRHIALAAGALVFGMAPAALAQGVERAAATITGRVTERAGGAPVPGARVRFPRSGFDVRTDADGRFGIVALLRVPDTLHVTAIGYAELRFPLAAVPGGDIDLRLDAAPVALQDLVVTGSRREQRTAELAVPVTTVTRADVAASAAPSVDQVVGELPGLQGIGFPPTGSDIMIRGIGEGRVLVLVDGEPTPGAQLENRDVSRYSTLGVQRIEVVKGPLSALYGSDALGGVINIITETPRGPLAVDATGRMGALGRREANAQVSGGGRLGYRVAGGWRQQDRVAGVAGTSGEQALQRVWDVRSSFRYAATGTLALRADVNFLRERQRWPVAPGFSGFNDNRAWSAWTEATLDANPHGTWRLRLFYQDYDHRYRQSSGDTPIADVGPPTQREQIARAAVAHTRQIGNHQLDAGVDLSYRHVRAADRLIGSELSDQMVELYAQDGARYGRLLGSVALRGTWNSRWGTALTPSLGLAFEPTGALRLRGSVGRGFRGPSFKELGWTFANLQAGYTIQGNPDLVPERSWHFSLGATWSPLGRLVVDADVFRNDIRHLIEQTVGGFTPSGLLIFTPRNVQSARTEGVELAVRYDTDVWDLSAGYAYLRARDREHDVPLNRRAPHTARLRAGYRARAFLGLMIDVTGRYTSSAPLVGDGLLGAPGIEGEQGAYLAWDVLGRANVVKGLQVQVGVDNLFDARPSGWQGVIRRQAFVGLSLRAGG
ncbi:MAG: TonB-dependent receptor [Gemmatimonadota bacterium]